MKPKAKKQLILSLIKDDLIHHKLINALNDLGLDANHYALHLQETIFDLMRIENTLNNESISQYYFRMCQQMTYQHNCEGLEERAASIYYYLHNQKK